MNGAGHEFLARAALAADEHGGAFGTGDFLDKLTDLSYGIALADDV